jgi:predicted acyl esterase
VQTLVIAAAIAGWPTGTAVADVPADAVYSQAYFPSLDGTVLHADVLRPKGLSVDSKTPVVMQLTPYNGHGDAISGQGGSPGNAPPNPDSFLATAEKMKLFERGYTFVLVDLRGSGASQGCFDWGGPGQQGDVKAAVQWAASRPWSTGKVGVVGLSYDGFTGVMALASKPRGLAAVVTVAPLVDVYDVHYMNRVSYWDSFASVPYYETTGAQPPSIQDDAVYQQHWLEAARPQCAASALDLDAQTANPDPDTPFWRARDLLAAASQSAVPVFGASGFLDGYDQAFRVPPNGPFRLWSKLRNLQQLWIGQWQHVWPGQDQIIGRDGFLEAIGRFFDQTLKDQPSSVSDPKVIVQQADGRWRTEQQWPPADAQPFTMPVRPGSYANAGDNWAGDEVTIDGFPSTIAANNPDTGRGSWTFTQPLPYEAHLAGSPCLDAKLAGPSGARLIALLYDVSPDGSAMLITRGATTVGNGTIDLQLFPEDWTLPAGHRLGLLLTNADNSWFPPGQQTTDQVQIQSGALLVPALRYQRNTFITGGRGQDWGIYKRPIHVDPATISANTIATTLPPKMAAPTKQRPASCDRCHGRRRCSRRCQKPPHRRHRHHHGHRHK